MQKWSEVFKLYIYIFFLRFNIRIILDIGSKRVENILQGLNDEFMSFLDEPEATIHSAYNKMIHKNPYRVLAQHTFDMDEEPLDEFSKRQPPMTDVIYLINMCVCVL